MEFKHFKNLHCLYNQIFIYPKRLLKIENDTTLAVTIEYRKSHAIGRISQARSNGRGNVVFEENCLVPVAKTHRMVTGS